jgi:apolipoprotein D and lipocalin family protein
VSFYFKIFKENFYNFFLSRNVTFGGQEGGRANYWILSTDYDNYAVVVSCSNLPLSRSFESFWLLSRTPKITPDSRRNADAIIDRHLERSRIRITNQDQTL